MTATAVTDELLPGAAEDLCRRYLVFQDVHFFHLGIMGLEQRWVVAFQRGGAGDPRQQYGKI